MNIHMNKGQVDMLHGSLAMKIIVFALPLIASGILQQSFNAVDVAVIGQYSSSNAIAAVGSNGPVISILINLFLGIAVGANVVLANYLGHKDKEGVRRSISTIAVVAIVSGFLLMIIGVSWARPILEAMNAPSDVIDLATTYLRVYFCGMPFMMIYNFGAAIMRSIGDTQKPFYALVVANIVNLGLDLLFVVGFDMGVAGVALATVIANACNAAMMVFYLLREPDPLTLRLKQSKFSTSDFGKMLRIGVPAGLQGMVFSISNIFIQSSINNFGSNAIAGSAAALTFESYCYYIVVAFCGATLAFAGQNYGAGNFVRCRKVYKICLMYAAVFCFFADFTIIIFQEYCIGIFTSDARVFDYASQRFHTVLAFQFIASTYEIAGSYMRGLGFSFTPMVLTIFGTCVLRLGWVGIFKEIDNTFTMLLTIYPITWIVTGLAVVIAAHIVERRAFKVHSIVSKS